MDYEKCINWNELPKGITHIRFEAITMAGNTMNCYGIGMIKRPDAPSTDQQQVQANFKRGPTEMKNFEATAWCHICYREFTVFVSGEDFKDGICYDECECGKSGQFCLVLEKGDSSKRPIYDGEKA